MNPDFSITTCARSSGDAAGLVTGIARGSGAVGRSIGVGDAFANSALFGLGVLSGSAAFFAFAVLVLDFGAGLFLAVDLCFDVFDFAVGLGFSVGDGADSSDSDSPAAGLGFAFAFGFDSGDEVFFLPVDFFFFTFCLGVGLGDSSGSVEEAVRVFRKSSRFRFSSSCARRIVTRIALSATAVVNQRRRRATGAERNREKNAINPGLSGQAACVPGTGTGSVASRWRCLSRRRIAFNFPPTRRSKQVRYIQVSSMIMDANAR